MSNKRSYYQCGCCWDWNAEKRYQRGWVKRQWSDDIEDDVDEWLEVTRNRSVA